MAVIRDDLSDRLIHLTRGDSGDPNQNREEAFKRFYTIAKQGKLIGGTGYIRGSYRCVCFTEAPISKLSYILSNPGESGFKYAPYGVMVTKRWLYGQGGRPVIYGPATEFDELPELFRYRHVRFWLGDDYDVDHTWEREWRLRTDELALPTEHVTFVLPERAVKEEFEKAFPNRWHYLVLSDLGVKIEAL